MVVMNKSQRIQTPIQSISLKLVTKILLPFSLLSAILSCPLLCNFQALAYSLQLFSFSVGKTYMFVLCNGLIFFIATGSGLIGSFGVESDVKADRTARIKLEVESSEPKGSILKSEVDHREELPPSVVEDEGEEERWNELVSVDEDEDEDEALGLMSNEELNKKCEDFIRRMKEGIQFEARNRLCFKK
ncbi:Tetratricopeptide repeat-like superfamily protein [Hibiscus syriacus]|uniref:Tetratricopeptide repeat-like superfamily protein n=1 Tax=Hibiscus syriacus TaxID=106335 RepID=A0A6A3AB74_HIBSY|nr:uncharacterized protein LOC120130670 [Hibiscus syriacus]KAE8701358.1 Tetratricopeptide repeat-like superfamily protein [Hibiscus syriacus]